MCVPLQLILMRFLKGVRLVVLYILQMRLCYFMKFVKRVDVLVFYPVNH